MRYKKLKVKVIESFNDSTNGYETRKVGDVIEVDQERFEKLKNLGLVKETKRDKSQKDARPETPKEMDLEGHS